MKKVLETAQSVANLDTFLMHVLSDVANGDLEIGKAHSGLTHLIHLIDNREQDAENWLREGRKLIRK